MYKSKSFRPTIHARSAHRIRQDPAWKKCCNGLNKMGKAWSDLGNGQQKLVLTNASGAVLSTYYGTRDEILEKLADSQVNAGARIQDLKNGNGHTNPPKPMTAGERMQTVSDLANPATVDQGILRVMESVVGPVAELRQDREADRMDRAERAAIAAAE